MPERYRQAVLAAALSLVLLPDPAQACAYDGLALDLALAHPASLEVSLAVAQAYQDKLIGKPVTLPGGFGMRRALSMLDKLHTRLPAATPSFYLLLVEPGLWARVEPTGVALHVAPPAPDAAVAILGEGVLLALQKGQLSGEQALQRGVLHLAGAEQLRQAWRVAYPEPAPDPA